LEKRYNIFNSSVHQYLNFWNDNIFSKLRNIFGKTMIKINKPGALRIWLLENLEKVQSFLGFSPFNKDGTISVRALKKLLKGIKEGKFRAKGITVKRIVFALNSRKWKKVK
jgi:hypothetical protein